MATEDLEIRVTGTDKTQAVIKALSGIEKAFTSISKTAVGVEKSLASLERRQSSYTKSVNQSANANRDLVKTLLNVASGYRRTKAGLTAFLAVLVVRRTLLTASSLITLADSFKTLELRVNSLAKSTGDIPDRFQSIKDIANEAGIEVGTLVEIYNRVALASEELQLPTEKITILLRSVAKAATASGASAFNLKAGLIQLSQSFSSQIVRAEELNSVNENIPFVANIAAKQLGITAAELRKQVLAGTLTSKVFANALIDAKDDIDNAFKPLERTLPAQINRLKNAFSELITEVVKDVGLLDTVADVIDKLIESVRNGDLDLSELAAELNNIIQGLSKSIPALVKTVTELGKALADTIRGLDNFFTGIGKLADLTPYTHIVRALTEQVSELGQGLQDVLGEERDDNSLTNAFEKIQRDLDKTQKRLNEINIVPDEVLEKARRNIAILKEEIENLKAGTFIDGDDGLVGRQKLLIDIEEKISSDLRNNISGEKEKISLLAEEIKLRSLALSKVKLSADAVDEVSRKIIEVNKQIAASTTIGEGIPEALKSQLAELQGELTLIDYFDKGKLAEIQEEIDQTKITLNITADEKITKITADYLALNEAVLKAQASGSQTILFKSVELDFAKAKVQLNNFESDFEKTLADKSKISFSDSDNEKNLKRLNAELLQSRQGSIVFAEEKLAGISAQIAEIQKNKDILPGFDDSGLDVLLRQLVEFERIITKLKNNGSPVAGLKESSAEQIALIQQQRKIFAVKGKNEKDYTAEVAKFVKNRFDAETKGQKDATDEQKKELEKRLKNRQTQLKKETSALKTELRNQERLVKKTTDKIKELRERIKERGSQSSGDEYEDITSGIAQSKQLSIQSLTAFSRGDLELAEQLATKQAEITQSTLETASARREAAEQAVQDADSTEDKRKAQSELSDAIRLENKAKKEIESTDTNLELIQPRLLKLYETQLEVEKKNLDVIKDQVAALNGQEKSIQKILDALSDKTKLELKIDISPFTREIQDAYNQLEALQAKANPDATPTASITTTSANASNTTSDPVQKPAQSPVPKKPQIIRSRQQITDKQGNVSEISSFSNVTKQKPSLFTRGTEEIKNKEGKTTSTIPSFSSTDKPKTRFREKLIDKVRSFGDGRTEFGRKKSNRSALSLLEENRNARQQQALERSGVGSKFKGGESQSSFEQINIDEFAKKVGVEVGAVLVQDRETQDEAEPEDEAAQNAMMGEQIGNKIAAVLQDKIPSSEPLKGDLTVTIVGQKDQKSLISQINSGKSSGQGRNKSNNNMRNA